jgi:hypothetical protein
MAGSTISLTGPISYASGSISAGETTSLLSTFTEVSNAVPVAGNKMYPVYLNDQLYYSIDSGSYAGNYYINRHDSYGLSAWTNRSTGGGIRLNQLRGYRHWPADNYVYPRIRNFSSDDHDVLIQFNAIKVFQLSLGAISANDYDPGDIVPCSAVPDQYNAFESSGVNDGWSVTYTVTNTTQTYGSSVTVDVIDWHTTEALHSNFFDLNAGTVWSFEDGYSNFYWKVPAIAITMY